MHDAAASIGALQNFGQQVWALVLVDQIRCGHPRATSAGTHQRLPVIMAQIGLAPQAAALRPRRLSPRDVPASVRV